MTTKQFDVIVIGGGPGGYIAAIRAAQLGFNVACIDEWKNAKGGPALGGTCTNIGCIPSKALLQSSEHYEHAGHHFADHGIEVKGLSLDMAKMIGRKDTVVKQNNEGVLYLFKKNKVTFFHGRGSFAAGKDGLYDIKVAGATEEVISGKHIIVATGSNARTLPGTPFDEETILSNDGALRMVDVPKRLGLIGSGVIGLEMGSVWRRLGAEVTVLEGLPTFLGAVDESVAKEALKLFKKQGMTLRTGTKVTGATVANGKATLTVEPAAGGEASTIEADVVLVSIGRKPNTDGLGLDKVGLAVNARGQVDTDHDFRTIVPSIWAIGDVIPGPMLAHKAEDEGIAAAENIAGGTGIVNHDVIPTVVYTYPEIAGVGLSEEDAKAKGHDIKVGKFPFAANSRAKTNRDTDGFVKVIADAKSDRVLGVWIISSLAGTLIAEAALAMEFGATSEDIAYTCHAHPTYAEALKEAAMAVQGLPIHI